MDTLSSQEAAREQERLCSNTIKTIQLAMLQAMSSEYLHPGMRVVKEHGLGGWKVIDSNLMSSGEDFHPDQALAVWDIPGDLKLDYVIALEEYAKLVSTDREKQEMRDRIARAKKMLHLED